jgi:hypothetical protein
MLPVKSETFKWWQEAIIFVVCYIEALSFDLVNIPIPDWCESAEYLQWRDNLLSMVLQINMVMSVPEDVQ